MQPQPPSFGAGADTYIEANVLFPCKDFSSSLRTRPPHRPDSSSDDHVAGLSDPLLSQGRRRMLVNRLHSTGYVSLHPISTNPTCRFPVQRKNRYRPPSDRCNWYLECRKVVPHRINFRYHAASHRWNLHSARMLYSPHFAVHTELIRYYQLPHQMPPFTLRRALELPRGAALYHRQERAASCPSAQRALWRHDY